MIWFRILICASLIVQPWVASAQDDPIPGWSPLWELGMGVGLVHAPDYPGANHSREWVIPFPFGVYRGEILHSDRRGGTRARLLRSATYEINVSAGGGLPSSSRANQARAGMPDLEWLGQIGPRLMFDIWKQEKEGGRVLRLGVPIRSVISTNGRRFVDRGFIFSPELMYDNPRVFGTRADGYIHLTVDFIDRRFANYYYEVKSEYATAERREYAARGGYLQTDLSLGFMVPFKRTRLRLFTFGSVTDLQGSANRNSPLFKAAFNTSVSVVALWVFGQSEIQVQSDD